MEPLTRFEKYAAHESLLACFRAAIAAAYAQQVRRGFTIEFMATRIGWKPAKMADLLLVPQGTKLDQIALVCFAMNCEPNMETVGGKFVISVQLLNDWSPRDRDATLAETNEDSAPSEGSQPGPERHRPATVSIEERTHTKGEGDG
jgi:hypothetical protein